MDEIVRICHIHGKLLIADVYRKKHKNRKKEFYFRCKKCVRIECSKNKESKKNIDKKYKINNKEKVNERWRNYRSKNKDKFKIKELEYRTKHRNEISLRHKKCRENLDNFYILGMLKKIIIKKNKFIIPSNLITKELIDLKRILLLIKREIRSINESKQNTNA